MINSFFNIIFRFFKYFLFCISFSLLLFGIYKVYGRLNKDFFLSYYIFIPFLLMFIALIIDLFMKNDIIKKNLLFNFVSCLVFIVIIVICLRAQFDYNLLLNLKYGISYNTFFLADNINIITFLMYMLFFTNTIMIIYSIVDSKKQYVEEVIARKIIS